MFNDGGGHALEVKSIQECKPDFEAQAASLKVKLDSAKALKAALFDFARKNNTHQFQQISSFAEMVGGVEMVKQGLADHYDELLKRIEKDS